MSIKNKYNLFKKIVKYNYCPTGLESVDNILEANIAVLLTISPRNFLLNTIPSKIGPIKAG